MSDNTPQSIANLLQEDRSFPPSAAFTAQAVGKAELYEQAAADREDFWRQQARKYVTWDTEPSEVLDWSNPPFAKWFADGRLNVSYNCLDRHVAAGIGDRTALHFIGEPGDEEDISYAELLDRVQRAANALASAGVGKGDRVAIYLPMISEAVVAMLACARLGAPHSVVFGGFSADALRSRIDDAEAKVVITADGSYRRGQAYPLKAAVDEALDPKHGESSAKTVFVVQRTKSEINWVEGRDRWWHEELAAASNERAPEIVDAEHPLFILYTSGTTGKPKGILHTTGGYLVQAAYTNAVVHDVHPESDVYWCSADVGWITGHSYVTYGPLANGATQVVYEGTPDTPHRGRWWEIIQEKKVTIFYTAPTAIRTFMKWGSDIPEKYDLSSLRVLGSVGEPINPEAWIWYREVIGGGETPIVDTWWQTETGAIMMSALPGVTDLKPGSCQLAVPGVTIDVVDEMGDPVPNGHGGYLVIRDPWPSMLRGIWGDEQRYIDTYWSNMPDTYFAGDGAKRDEEGNIWVVGRVDDVMNVSGHRLSTSEIESALVSHDAVAEAAVVGAKDDTTGQAVVAFCIVRGTAAERAVSDPDGLVAELRAHVGKEIGPIAKPRKIMLVSELPKTRSGKIMRRLLRDIAENRDVGDVTTLADANVMKTIQADLQTK